MWTSFNVRLKVKIGIFIKHFVSRPPKHTGTIIIGSVHSGIRVILCKDQGEQNSDSVIWRSEANS